MSRVLMLGGDPDIVEAGRRVLVKEGYTVAMAHDIRDVLALVDHFQPDLLFVDVIGHEPADGVSAGAEVRRAGLRLPILIMATVGRHIEFFTYAEDGTAEPVPDFLEKPMDPAALVNTVRYLLTKAEGTPAD